VITVTVTVTPIEEGDRNGHQDHPRSTPDGMRHRAEGTPQQKGHFTPLTLGE
jgi:hypothetical protein